MTDVSAEARSLASQFDDDPPRPEWLTEARYASIRSLSDGEMTVYDRTNPEAWLTVDDDHAYEVGGGRR